MKKIEDVHGSEQSAQPLIIGKSKVYVHTNIRKDDNLEDVYIYDEIQYDKDEYIQLLSTHLDDANSKLENTLNELTNVQLAVVNLYEQNMGG